MMSNADGGAVGATTEHSFEHETPITCYLAGKVALESEGATQPSRPKSTQSKGKRNASGVFADAPTNSVAALTMTGSSAPFRCAKLPYPFDSLDQLLRYLDLHCRQLAQKRPLANEEFLLSDPLVMQVLLKSIGYLGASPLLRCVILHHVYLSGQFQTALQVLDILRRDVSKLYISLESMLRHTFFAGGRLLSHVITQHSLHMAAFTISLRHDVSMRLEALKRDGPRPMFLIVPSQIEVANFGVFLRGTVPKDTPLLGYAGEIEESDAYSSGYRMTGVGSSVVDALTERCLCSMMNDARFSHFSNTCSFKGRGRVRAIAKRVLQDEELFVGYGTAFRFALEETAASFSRAVAADFAAMCKGTTLPVIEPCRQICAVRKIEKRTRSDDDDDDDDDG